MSERQVKGINSHPPLIDVFVFCLMSPRSLYSAQKTSVYHQQPIHSRETCVLAGKSEPSIHRFTNPPVSLKPPGVIFPAKGSSLGLFLTQICTQGLLYFSTVSQLQWGAASSVVVSHCRVSGLSLCTSKMGRKLLQFPWLQLFVPKFDKESPANTTNPARRARIHLCLVKNKTEEQSGWLWGAPQMPK